MSITVFMLGVNLAVLLGSVMFFRREIRRQGTRADEGKVELVKLINSLDVSVDMVRSSLSKMDEQRKSDVESWLSEEARTADALRKVWEALEPLPKVRDSVDALEKRRKEDMQTLLHELKTTAGAFRLVFERLEEMPSRQDAVQALERLEALMKETPAGPSGDEESQLSRAIEEGVANLLQYTGGKAAEVRR